MTFSQYAGFAIVPTLSRIVLCAAFITAGYGKVFTEAEFSAEEAARLKQKWGVIATPKQIAAADSQRRHVTLASYQQSDPPPPPPPEDEPADEPDGEPQEPPATEPSTQPQDEPAPEPPAATEPALPPPAIVPPPSEQPKDPAVDPSRRRRTLLPPPAATEPSAPAEQAPTQPPPAADASSTGAEVFYAAKMYKLTLMLDDIAWPQPLWMSRIAAYMEFYGGILLALGLFSRLWALGLAGVMVGAFWITSLPMLNGIGWALFQLKIPDEFNQVFVQAALFVLAFGVLLTGAGPLSLDRLLFGGGGNRGRAGVLRDEVVSD